MESILDYGQNLDYNSKLLIKFFKNLNYAAISFFKVQIL